MMILKVKDKEYKVKFGYNSFCDTDLMERTNDLIRLIHAEDAENDRDVTGMGKIKDLFTCVRDLLFVGFKKYNPVESAQEIGDILDDYHDEGTEEDRRGILDLFVKLSEELMAEGFLGELMIQISANQKEVKVPQDHKKKQK